MSNDAMKRRKKNQTATTKNLYVAFGKRKFN